METLVSTDWLSAHLDDRDLVVLDCTIAFAAQEGGGFKAWSGRERYDQAHIPGAGFADLTGELSDQESPHVAALPTPEAFCATMGRLGVGDDTRVVLYDNMMSACAARVWWMLRWVGFDNAALLDGGLKAWTAEERPVSADPVTRSARTLTLSLRAEVMADRDEVFASLGNPAVRIIDTLSADHFSGKSSMYERPGHIPGAVLNSAFDLIDESGRYRSAEELGTMIDGERSARAITYCGGGIAASSNAFIMTRLGFTDVAVYAASLQEWAADPANPMETAVGCDQ